MTSRLTRVRVALLITCLLVSLLPGTAFGSSITTIPTPPPAGAATTAAAASTGQATNVVINEILAHTDEPQVDTIELYNPTAAPIAIGGWFLSDDGDVLDRYQIPPEVAIPADGYQLFTSAELGFALSEFGETVFLYAPGPDGRPQTRVDHVKFGVSPNGISFGRYETSTGAVHYPLQRAVSLGEANAGPLVSDLIISEIMYHPTTGSEYLIVANRSNAEFPLYDVLHPENRWKINVDGKDVFVFPAGTRLAPGAAIAIAGTTPATLRSEYRVPASMASHGPLQRQAEQRRRAHCTAGAAAT